jgi:hypothetical protein
MALPRALHFCRSLSDIDDLESLPWHATDGTDNLAWAGCIRSRFQDALKSGIIWPARWVTTFLDPQHYRQILGDELYEAYRAKERVKAAEPPPDTPPIPDGLTRGVEVQICPNPGCKKLIGLRDGCNHIICEACTQNFAASKPSTEPTTGPEPDALASALAAL